MYVCQNCHKKIEQVKQFVTCPYCGSKILKKARPPVAKSTSTE